MRPSIRRLKSAVKLAAKEPVMKPQKMKRENFETALSLAIEIQARHEFDEWRMKASQPEFNTSNPTESLLLTGFRDVLAASKEGRSIDIED